MTYATEHLVAADGTAPAPHHRLLLGNWEYPINDRSTPNFAAIAKARDALIELVSRECGDDQGRMGAACGVWIDALEGLPSLEGARDDDLNEGGVS